MQYVIANKKKAAGYGISAVGHRAKDTFILLNEKELNVVPGETLADRVRAVSGTLYTASEVKRVLQQEDWK